MVRDRYWVNHNFINATLGQVFEFNRPPRLPVFSNWVVDFNAFFDTGGSVPVHNKARKIDSVMESSPIVSGVVSGRTSALSKRIDFLNGTIFSRLLHLVGCGFPVALTFVGRT
jgi:hypothetical protein